MPLHDNHSSNFNARRNRLFARRKRLHDVSSRIERLRKEPFVGVKEVDDNIEFEIVQLVKVRNALRG